MNVDFCIIFENRFIVIFISGRIAFFSAMPSVHIQKRFPILMTIGKLLVLKKGPFYTSL